MRPLARQGTSVLLAAQSQGMVTLPVAPYTILLGISIVFPRAHMDGISLQITEMASSNGRLRNLQIILVSPVATPGLVHFEHMRLPIQPKPSRRNIWRLVFQKHTTVVMPSLDRFTAQNSLKGRHVGVTP